MREKEGYRHSRHAIGTEPLVGEPEVRMEPQIPLDQLAPDLRDERLEGAALDVQVEVGEPQVEQALVVPFGPLGRG